jgi:hypothetical protein
MMVADVRPWSTIEARGIMIGRSVIALLIVLLIVIYFIVVFRNAVSQLRNPTSRPPTPPLDFPDFPPDVFDPAHHHSPPPDFPVDASDPPHHH